MTKFKDYPGLSKEDCFEVNLNAICNSFEFKSFISQRHKKCPANLTVGCHLRKNSSPDYPSYVFPIEVKNYGYFETCNRGQAYSDLLDYTYGEDISEEMKKSVEEYFRTYEPEFYKYMEGNMR